MVVLDQNYMGLLIEKKFKHRLVDDFFWIKEYEFKYFYPKATQAFPK